jgi:predicted transcriptional regulator
VESDFLRASDVAKMLGCSKSTAYRLMRKLRAELDSKGLITLAGIVPKHYFMERMGVDYRG